MVSHIAASCYDPMSGSEQCDNDAHDSRRHNMAEGTKAALILTPKNVQFELSNTKRRQRG